MLQSAREAINKDELIARAVAIQQIPAPTFDEGQRAAYVHREFEQLGLTNIEEDDLYNVYGWLESDLANAPVLLISAHTDTVFPANTDLSTRYKDDRIYGPGLGDNSLGVAGLLTLAELFVAHNLPHHAHICFVANSREEGLGNLDGIRGVANKLASRIKAGIVIEGMALGRIYHAGIAVRRLRLRVTGSGGHSWLHFGCTSAVHELMRFGNEVTQLHVSDNPRTTYNIGIVNGGSSINTIAAEAECYIDLRSEDADALQHLESQVRAIGERLSTAEVRFNFQVVGDRPAGYIPVGHPIVKLAQNAHEAIYMTSELDRGSTDANVLIERGIPTVCVGISYGGNAHRLDEYIETAPLEAGMWQLLLLATATANGIAGW